MKENKEELIKIGQEQIDKAVNLFEGKAIDTLNFLTEQFKNDFAEEIDSKIQGYKKDFDRLLLEYYELETENKEFCEHNKKLREEIEQLKYEQSKVAVEKLEELRARFDNSPIIFFHDTELNEKERAIVRDEYEDAKFIFRDNIDQLLAELKGESDE